MAQRIMDKFWSLCAMPIGVLFCFGPVLVAWWLAERKGARPDDRDERLRRARPPQVFAPNKNAP